MNLLKFIIKYIKNKLLKFKTMCDCSGKCNCSTGIPRGPRGLTGATGGIGPSPTIEVGTTTTGAPGSEVVITNSGTSTAAVFDFTIPRGNVGLTGPAGTNGTNGTSSVERFSPNLTSLSSDPGTDEYNFLINVLDIDGYIAKFEFYFTSQDQTGFFGGAAIQLNDGVNLFSLFSISSSDLDAALIKYDVNPTTGLDSGYPSAQGINFLSGDISIERTSSTTLTITGIVYGENIQLQDDFGGAKFVQKSWRVFKELTVNDALSFSIKVYVTGTVNGSSSKIFNILRYLTPVIIP